MENKNFQSKSSRIRKKIGLQDFYLFISFSNGIIIDSFYLKIKRKKSKEK